MRSRVSIGFGFVLVTALCAFLSFRIFANPQVVGYERFHSGQASAAGGAILFSELGCANCHGESPVVTPRKGPNLVDLKQRVDHGWVTSFLKNPEAGRSGSTMPKMGPGLSGEEVESVTAFLGTKGKGIKFNNGRHANAERGSALYHEKGCVACHAPTVDFHSPHVGPALAGVALAIPHPDLKKKTSLEALNHFLAAPARYRPDGRMPHLILDRQEAMDIAAHLMDFQASDPTESSSVKAWPAADAVMIKKGRALTQKMNCAACHDIPGEKAKAVVKLSDIPSRDGPNCLSTEPVAGLPFYDLSDAQRASLNLYLKSRGPDAVPEISTTLAAMNCYACHERDGLGGPTNATDPWFIGDEGLGDSGRLPPPLTGIGFKLQRKWLEDVLKGSATTQVRPYLKTQMPAYHGQAEILAEFLERADAKEAQFKVSHSPEILEAGRKLLGTQGGVSCITCHTWGTQPSLGIQALDISSLGQRLRPEWFHQYLLNPSSYRPQTLMPELWPGGKSMVPGVLGGKTDQQIAAIWAFIEKGKGLPDGFPDRSGGEFELIPKDRPIIQRTFFKKTGTKAILVGFPGEINIAYDGLKAYPSRVWKGRFFDAYNTWFTRAAPFEQPLSDEVFEFPQPKVKGRFRGYRIEASGNPTFLIQADGRSLEESFSVDDGKLSRTIFWEEGAAPAVTHPAGVEVKQDAKENTLTFIYSWK
jgi:mono/diheme cytochrome c family protein